MVRIILLFIVCFSLHAHKLIAQSATSWPKTLLWRISGNGLAKNSYLYGTMHLQDKRLFYFSDSMYHYLEQAEGYALEIDLQEFMDSVMQKMINEKDVVGANKKFSDLKNKRKVVDSLIQNVKKYQDKRSKKQLEKWRAEKLKKALKNKEMPTIMDAYLYGIAKKHGKWLGGIEDVSDQLALYDEFGAEVSSDELLLPDSELTANIEDMVSIYLSADLNMIEKYMTNQDYGNLGDEIFLNRNIKMAKRMDSLAQIRSMFFTVGAAHLPGDSGVINLLKNKGYKLDPVFSSQKVDPVKYASRLREIPWEIVEDDLKTFEVTMPGKASTLSMFNDLFKMKLYADITTMTFFIAGSTPLRQNADLDKMMKNFAENTGGQILSKNKIGRGELAGIESVVSANENYYKLQFLNNGNMMYMLLAGGENKGILASNDVLKFFQSFVPKKTPVARETEWASFGIEEKAFTIMFPGQPKQNKTYEKMAEGTDWVFTTYDYGDNLNGMYFMIQVRDLKPGHYLQNDSVYFSSIRDNFKKAVDTLTEEMTTFHSFPACRLDGESPEDGLRYRTLTVNRGNRVYSLFVAGAVNKTSDLLMEKFLSSFNLTEYKKTEWRKTQSIKNDFYTSLPFSLELKQDDKEPDEQNEADRTDSLIHYVSFNPNDAVSYEIFREKLSPYYWTTNDSVFFENIGLGYKHDGDSILSKRWVTNGKLRGTEWVMAMPRSNVRKKFRLILNADTLYSLISFLPSQYIENRETGQFFDGFRANHENPHPTIFKSKASQLLTDLGSTDSTIFRKANSALSSAKFTEEDLPFLHRALINSYLDDNSQYYNSRDRIIEIVEEIADSSTLSFIQQNFAKLPAEKEALKFDLLDVLARHRTEPSYSLLKTLLLEHTPGRKGITGLSHHVTDSLDLTKMLFPEILKLANNNLFAERIISISLTALDSGLISLEMLQPYKANFVHTADTILAHLKKNEDYNGYAYLDIVNLLAAFNDKHCDSILQKYLRLDNLTLKQAAVVRLMMNDRAVSPVEVEKLAADKYYRRDIYDELKKINKLKYYPVKYLSQRHLAESDMWNYAYDDDEPSSVSYLGERVISTKSKKQRFHLFKIEYSYESEDSGKMEVYKYLGVAGPFSTDVKNLLIENDITGIYYDENFDPKKIDKHLAAYMKSLEETELKK